MYEIFEQLLQSYSITAYKFCKDTGISQSTISTWKKKGNLISGELAKIIAGYFNVSVDYLMTGEEKEAQQYYLNDETKKIAQEIFENKELRILFDASRKAKPEDLLFAAEMIKKLKEKENND
jgi:transcriptional regulator with XRE-family HTH domain